MSLPQLFTYSAYSLMESTLTIPNYVKQAQACGYQTLGLCDHNVLTGAAEFYRLCTNQKIKPIIGLTLDYVSPVTEGVFELALIAKNLAGYHELIQLSSEKMITEQVYLETIVATKNLVAILLPQHEFQAAVSDESQNQRLHALQRLFGVENLYWGVSPQLVFSKSVTAWWEKQGVKPFAFYHVNAASELAQRGVQVMHHIKAGSQITELAELNQPVTATVLLANSALENVFQDEATAHNNTLQVMNLIDWQLPLKQKLLPHYPSEQAADRLLRTLCEEGKNRVESWNQHYQERLEYELSIIHQMGFDDYFLIVWDVMRFAHQQEIVTGAGRGSAAGSLVAFLLAITEVDPLKYELLFERFLNPERYSMPDIDLDFPDNRRVEILNYVQQKYGHYQMAQIATFGTMAAKMVLRDVSRAFGLSQSEANRWSRAIPPTSKITLNEAYQESKQLRELVNLSEKNQQIFSLAQVLEGLPRHVSTHAAGVVISDRDLRLDIPLRAGAESILLTQFTMGEVEAAGLLKIDFLGLKNLSIIDDTLKIIQQQTQETITQKDILLADPKTLQLFRQGQTAGIFQFESAGIRNVLKQVQPMSIEDIAAVNALYRPGPMKNIDHFVKRKNGQEAISYLDHRLQPILQNTYGVMVYQEQIMSVASEIAGFTLGQADILRRAISKKEKTTLDQERNHFLAGAKEKGLSLEKAQAIYQAIEYFADYGFNRSHAFAYSMIAFQMAYLKVHYPFAFFLALFRSSINTPAKVREYLVEGQKMQLTFLPPTINDSQFNFSLTANQQIQFGLGSIKGVRRDFVQAILSARQQEKFKDVDDFLRRIEKKWQKSEYLIPLIEVGVFDELTANRRQLLQELAGKIQNLQYSGGSRELLDLMALKPTSVADYSAAEKLAFENLYLGVYLTSHPVSQFKNIRQTYPLQLTSELIANQRGHILLYVTNIREIRTKKGELMAFVDGDDQSGALSLTVFPELYRQTRQQWEENECYYISGRCEVSKFNGQLQLIVERVELAKTLEESLNGQTCFLKITPENEQPKVLAQLSMLIEKNSGATPVIMYYERDQKKKRLPKELWVTNERTFITELGSLLGKENVVFR
ncbi:MAG: DNA polymerase III subunit alpha [Enterococcus sp.]